MELKRRIANSWAGFGVWLESPKHFSFALVLAVLAAFVWGMYPQSKPYDDFSLSFPEFALAVDVFDRKLLGALAICAMYVSVTGKLRPVVVLIAFWLSSVEQTNSFFATVVHPFILNHAEILYSTVFWRGAHTVSAEFPRLLLMVLALVVLLVQVSIKRWRTFDRMLVAISFAGVMGTFIAFHTVAVVHVKHFGEVQKTHMRSLFISFDKNYIERACRNEKLDCLVTTTAILDKMPDSVPEFIRNDFKYMSQDMKNYSGGDFYYVSFAKNNHFTRWDGFITPDFLSYVPVYFAFDKNRNFALLAVNNYSHGGYLMLNLKIQSILVIIAHTTWFFLLMSLWMFHRSRFSARVQRERLMSGVPTAFKVDFNAPQSSRLALPVPVNRALYALRWLICAGLLAAVALWAYLQVGGFFA